MKKVAILFSMFAFIFAITVRTASAQSVTSAEKAKTEQVSTKDAPAKSCCAKSEAKAAGCSKEAKAACSAKEGEAKAGCEKSCTKSEGKSCCKKGETKTEAAPVPKKN